MNFNLKINEQNQLVMYLCNKAVSVWNTAKVNNPKVFCDFKPSSTVSLVAGFKLKLMPEVPTVR